jgi:hypothetical protein
MRTFRTAVAGVALVLIVLAIIWFEVQKFGRVLPTTWGLVGCIGFLFAWNLVRRFRK